MNGARIPQPVNDGSVTSALIEIAPLLSTFTGSLTSSGRTTGDVVLQPSGIVNRPATLIELTVSSAELVPSIDR